MYGGLNVVIPLSFKKLLHLYNAFLSDFGYESSMLDSFTTLLCIVVIAFVSPFCAYVTGGRWIRASAAIILLGWLFGPNAIGWIHPNASGIPFLQQLGLSFLFLMSGYSMEYKALKTPAGKHGSLSWAISFIVSLAIAFCIPFGFSPTAGIAFAFALTSTSLPKVNAELRGNKYASHFYTSLIESYGASGELFPICAFALLIGDSSPWIEAITLLVFVACAFIGQALVECENKKQTKLAKFVKRTDQGSLAMEQLVIVIMVGFTTFSIFLGADMIIAGFAAGWVLRRLVPDVNSRTMLQLRGVANGLFIPLTFVLSGASLDLATAFSNGWIMLAFITLLILVRGLPVLISLEFFKETRTLDQLQKISIAAYSCMTMSTIVAMVEIALESGDMTGPVASTLIGAAAIINIVMPLITGTLERIEAKKTLRE